MQTQRPRAGRPRMQDSDADTSQQDEETSRRARMRLAQRRYRSKKQDALTAAEQKAAALENALRGTISAFRGLQRSLIQYPAGYVPLDVNLAIGKTSVEMSKLLHSSGVQLQDTLACSLLDCTQATCARRILSESVTRSASDFDLQSSQGSELGSELGSFTPEFSPGMHTLPGELLPPQPMVQSSPGDILGNLDFAGRFLPQLHRKIEGSTEMVLRLAPPKLQRLKYGLTRTWFDTDLPQLAGEWLEASDVEEYLTQRGIHVRDKSQKTVTLHLGSEASEADAEGPFTPEAWEPELPDWTIFGRQLDERQDIPSGLRVVSAASPMPDLMGQSPTSSLPATPQRRITIDVDKLVAGLACKGICLGPAPGIRRHHVDEAIQGAVQIC
ncbi:C-5 cytosine methyltransferase DmtA [Beauveria brongniartii RCEF 3172]|uniref:C-5 cytosine methyltransferase DmtA n=1 Tax=Beauveria brongniartii RCEF 3172 TaxID=1081107 RepID=A0A167BL09_9HYPO|nr:C-5 cytosine methyltransferase DmtA [Beauveria brongniartii RCEF 3172]